MIRDIQHSQQSLSISTISFEEFLSDNGTSLERIIYLTYRDGAPEHLQDMINRNNAYVLSIGSLFTWSSTEEGSDYWNRLDNRWHRIIDEYQKAMYLEYKGEYPDEYNHINLKLVKNELKKNRKLLGLESSDFDPNKI